MKLFELYCRCYQVVIRLISPFLAWRNPELLEGPSSLLNLPALLEERGIERLLIVTDQVIARLGIMEPFLGGLRGRGIEFALFADTVPNPTIGNIESALSLYRENGCQAILAFGGGSPMDCAKGVGARVARPERKVEEMRGLLKVGRRLPPLFAVPTTAGTGSEVTVAAVISNPETHEKYPINDHALIPALAVLDPELTLGLPPHITATTGMDALTHAVEAFIGRSNTAGTERDAVEATRLIMENLERVYRDGKDLEGRGRLLKAAHLAGRAFTRAYVGNVHAVAHALSGFYGLPHGLANAVLLPHVLEYYGPAARGRLALLARRAGLAGEGGGDAEVAAAFIDRVRAMNRAMGIPERVECIEAADKPLMARRAHAEANPLYPVPRILVVRDIEALLDIASGAATGDEEASA